MNRRVRGVHRGYVKPPRTPRTPRFENIIIIFNIKTPANIGRRLYSKHLSTLYYSVSFVFRYFLTLKSL